MTSSNGGDRLDRIEQIVNSNAQAIQAMIEQRATDKLEHEQRMEQHERRIQQNEQQIERLDNLAVRLADLQEGVSKMVASLDEDRPTVLRRLMSIEIMVDRLLEEESEND